MTLAETMERVITIRFPKLEAESIDEMIGKLTELKNDLDTKRDYKVRLFTIAVVKDGGVD